MKSGVIFCLAGPSGSGKTTISDSANTISQGVISRITTVTTRQPRQNEIDGKDYHFWSEKKFKDGLKDDMFFEHQLVHGNFYGTLNGSLEEIIEARKISVIILDINGAITLKEKFPQDSVTVFVTCKSRKDLKERILQRKTTANDLQVRLNTATKEIETFNLNSSKFDYLIINDNLESSTAWFNNIIFHECVKRGQKLHLKD